jgi:hypothetical protein
MSLLVRIFLSFWLAMLLLAGSFFVLQRFYGGEIVEHAEAVLQAKAEVAALIWREGGERALRVWLNKGPGNRRLVLVDEEGEPLQLRPLPPHLRRWLPRRIKPGIESMRRGHLILAAELPGVTPKRFLLTEIDPGRLHLVPFWLRGLLAGTIFALVSWLLARMLTRGATHGRR